MELKEFESEKVLTFIPPDGEFSAMFYRISQDFPAPFRIITSFENNNYKLEFKLKIQANFPAEFFTDAFVVKFSVPKTSERVTFDNEGSKSKMNMNYSENEKKCTG